MVALNFARWLYQERDRYRGKTVLDMGSGSGIQGIVMALAGARHVVFNDNSEPAVKNTQVNVNKYGLKDKTTVYHGDLFEKIEKPVDIGFFNHPFFSTEEHPFFNDQLVRELIIPGAMVDNHGTTHRFLDGARTYIREAIFMPFYHPAGEANNPGVQGLKHGYKVKEVHNEEVNIGLQQGRVSIYELR
jgi:methylase of polypeptide subunit release factors